MIRFLFFIALGGSVSLLILSFSGSTEFTPWGLGFIVATMILLGLWIVLRIAQRSVERRLEIIEAQESGRIRAALIIGRRRTGLYVNEQPQIEFELLVDNPEGGPFRSTARKIVDMLDLHAIEPGALLTVAHPNPEYREVHLVDKPTPEPSYQLTQDAVATARQLPSKDEVKGKKKVPLLSNIVFTVALVGGFLGAPYLVTPHPEEYLQLLLDGRTSYEDVAEVDHAMLMDATELNTTLEALTAELGHDQVYSVTVFRTSFRADALTGTDPEVVTTFELQDHEVIDQDPAAWPYDEFDQTGFHLSDVDWVGILAGAPAAQQLLEERGLTDLQLSRFTVERSHTNIAPIEVRLYFDHAHGQETVDVDAHGVLSVAEQFAQVPEEELAEYLYDAPMLREGIEEMLAMAGTEHITDITSFGDRVNMEAYYMDGEHAGRSASLTYRPGEVYDMEEPRASHTDPEDTFQIDDIDWDVVDGALNQATTVAETEGILDTEVTHIVIRNAFTTTAGSHPLVINVYVTNAAGEGGYVGVNMDGNIGAAHL